MFKRFLDVKFLNRSNISNSQKILRAYSYVWLRTACIFHLILTITPWDRYYDLHLAFVETEAERG